MSFIYHNKNPDYNCMCLAEGYELCENCYLRREYEHENRDGFSENLAATTLASIKPPTVTTNFKRQPKLWQPLNPTHDEWYRPNGFSVRNKPRLSSSTDTTSSDNSSQGNSQSSSQTELTDVNASVKGKPEHETKFHKTPAAHHGTMLFVRRRGDASWPGFIDIERSYQESSIRSNVPQIPLEPDDALEKKFELAEKVKAWRRAHFDFSKSESRMNGRHREEYRRTSSQYKPGTYADKTGEGFLNTSGCFVNWDDWKAVCMGAKVLSKVSQKRLPSVPVDNFQTKSKKVLRKMKRFDAGEDGLGEPIVEAGMETPSSGFLGKLRPGAED